MTSCCNGLEGHFDGEKAEEELRRLRDDGPAATTEGLGLMLRAEGVGGSSLLDVGGGLGALEGRLFAEGLERAVHVEASPAFSRAARALAEDRGYAGTVEYRVGDALDLVPGLPSFDVVALDRVICCYPDMEALVRATAARADRLYAVSVPRDRWLVRAGLGLRNVVRALAGEAFRSFVHPVAAIDGVLRETGFERRRTERTFAWEMAVYGRVGPPRRR